MTPAGTPPTPIDQKRRRGTARPDRQPPDNRADVLRLDLTEARDATAVEAFVQALESEPAWLAQSDIATVALARELLAYLEEMAADPDAKPSQVATLFQRAQQVLGDLGLSPAGRRKLGVGDPAPAEPVGKLEQLRDRAKR